jgi:hypothetical protein
MKTGEHRPEGVIPRLQTGAQAAARPGKETESISKDLEVIVDVERRGDEHYPTRCIVGEDEAKHHAGERVGNDQLWRAEIVDQGLHRRCSLLDVRLLASGVARQSGYDHPEPFFG